MSPEYDLDKIKFSIDPQTFEKAVDLYENGKVINFEEEFNGFFATVSGTKKYQVYIDIRHYDRGDCECYLGQNGTLCKHMVAVAIHAVMSGKKLKQEDKKLVIGPVCSEKLGELTKEEFSGVKKKITSEMKYIKAYSGPSRTWFAYQNSLQEGCNRLSKTISELPISGQTAGLIIDMLLRLDDRLCRGGVDDSDGIVGGFIQEAVEVLKEYAKLDNSCLETFKNLKNKETCFGWEEPLTKLVL